MRMPRRIWLCILAVIWLSAWTGAGLCEETAVLHLPENLLIIEEAAFCGADGFSQVVLPEGITEIGPRAFAESSLTSIYLPASLTFIAEDAFSGCPEITFSAEADSYAYDWCVQRGLILLPPEVKLNSDAQTAWTGDAISWTASVSGGIQPHTCLLTLSLDGAAVLETEITPGEPYETVFEKSGLYEAQLSAADASGAQAVASAKVYVFDRVDLTDISLTQTGYRSAQLAWTASSASPAQLYLMTSDGESGEFTEFAPLDDSGLYTISQLPHNRALFFAIEARAGAQTADGTVYSCAVRSAAYPLTLCDAMYQYAVSGDACTIEGVQLWPDALSGAISVPAQLDGRPVVKIGKQAFAGNSAITSVSLPDGIQEIGSTAFYNCSALERVDLGGTVAVIGSYAFARCPALSELTLSSALSSIGDRAFLNDVLLTDVSLPGALTSIGSRAFYGTNVQTLNLPASLSELGAQALGSQISALTVGEGSSSFRMYGGLLYSGDLTRLVCAPVGAVGSAYAAPGALVSIDDDVFSGCVSLERVILSVNTTKIGSGAFRDCASLSLIENAQNITFIGDRAFSGCIILSDESFAGLTALQSIGSYAFAGCASLVSLDFPDTLTELSEAAFEGCTSLIRVGLPSEINRIGSAAFYGCSSLEAVDMPDRLTGSEKLGIYVFYGCSALREISVPKGVTSLGEYSFHGCSSLTAVTLPDSLTLIGAAAFFSCPKLTGIAMPDSVSAINAYAFANCFALQALTLPSCSLGSYAFGACYGLESVTFRGDGALTLASNAFYGCQKLSSVCLPRKISSISSAFSQCDLLTLYVEEGSEARSYLDQNGFAYKLHPDE